MEDPVSFIIKMGSFYNKIKINEVGIPLNSASKSMKWASPLIPLQTGQAFCPLF
jgi:hypothetical protein